MSRARAARGFAALVVIGILGPSTVACAPDAPPAGPRQAKENAPAWPDIFDGVPDLYAVIRPRALKRDGVYGSFWRSIMRVAQARGFARGATMVEAVEDAEEIIVGLSKGDDAALVLRGVPASLDPQRMNDGEGHPLFRALDNRGRVVEYQLLDRRDADAGSLVLPDRTWVGALGQARGRARQSFASPSRRPAPKVDPDAVAVVRLAGPLVHVLDRHPTYGGLSKRLASVTFSLKPGKAGLVVALAYQDADGVAWGEMEAKRIVQELVKDDKRFGWLKDAKVGYEGTTLFVRVAVPPRLLEELPNTTGADVGFEAPRPADQQNSR